MNRFLASIVSLAAALSFMVTSGAAQTNTFKGEITDERLNCVQTPMKAVAGINDKVGCVLYWAHFASPPSKIVLYDAAIKSAYQLDDQFIAQQHVGEKVEVTGTLDAAKRTIKVTGINVDESAYKTGAH